MQDREAIKITVEHCCDVIELKKVSPVFLKKLSKISIKSKNAEKEAALQELATTIVDSRNFIAHAKSNYQPNGNECPNKEIYNLSECMRVVAQQVIRWFGRQHENTRVI